jgi:signal transduction histidine kinase
LESKEGIDIFTIVLFGSLGMLSLVSFIVIFVVLYQKRMLANKTLLQENETRYQRRLLDASIEVAELERQKIATNMHDDVGLMLSTIKLNLSRIQRNLNDKTLVEELLHNNTGMIDETIKTIRSISHELMPKMLVKVGYVIGLKEMCNQINASGIIMVNFTNDTITKIHLNKKHELQLYRLVKEVANNIIRHAEASVINIGVSNSPTILTTMVSHNGKGIDTHMVEELAYSGKGIGLKSILSRAQLTGSVIQYITLGSAESKILIDTPLYENKN